MSSKLKTFPFQRIFQHVDIFCFFSGRVQFHPWLSLIYQQESQGNIIQYKWLINQSRALRASEILLIALTDVSF